MGHWEAGGRGKMAKDHGVTIVTSAFLPRACPGTASTAATKELAQLWRRMTLEERRPYW